jgi:hypothetical protein
MQGRSPKRQRTNDEGEVDLTTPAQEARPVLGDLPDWAIPGAFQVVAAATSFPDVAMVTAEKLEKAQVDASFVKKVAETTNNRTTEIFYAARSETDSSFLISSNISYPFQIDITEAITEDPVVGHRIKHNIPEEL